MSDQLIVAMSYLKASHETAGRDFIDHFVPLVADSLRRAGPDGALIPLVQDFVKAEYGLDVPQSALATILKRGKSQGLVHRAAGGRWKPNVEALAVHGLVTRREEYLARYEEILQRIGDAGIRTCGSVIPRDECQECVESIIADYSSPILRGMGRPVDKDATAFGTRRADVALSSLVIGDGDSLITDLATLAQGAMVASSLYMTDQLASVRNSLTNLNVYLDTRLALRLLGLAGPIHQKAVLEIIGMGRALSVRFWIFQDTLSEMDGVIRGAIGFLKRPHRASGQGEIVSYALQSGTTSTDLNLRIATLQRDVENAGVSIRERPRVTVANSIDESGLGRAVDTAINYRYSAARTHDIDCLSAVFRLRPTANPFSIERAGAVFLTSNVDLFKASEHFFRRSEGVLRVPVCLLDKSLGTLLWLKLPQPPPNVTRERLLADCYSALEPNDQLWVRFVKELDAAVSGGLLDAESAMLARVLPEARHLLARNRGGASTISSEDAISLARRLTDSIRSDERASMIEGLPDPQSSELHEADVADLDDSLDSEEPDPDRLRQDAAGIERDEAVSARFALESTVRDWVESRADKVARRVRVSVWLVGLLFVLLGVAGLVFEMRGPRPLLIGLGFVSLVLIALSAFGSLNGASVASIAEGAARRARARSIRRAMKGMNLSDG